MSEDWKKFDLGGGGLQSANLRLARLLKRRSIAYALTALFPLGLHRDYLGDRRGGWLYRAGAGAAVALLLAGQGILAAVALGGLAALAVYDLVRMERRIAAINKRLRMAVYMSQGEGAPAGYRGRVTDEDESRPPRAPSFSEQERLLRHLARDRKSKE